MSSYSFHTPKSGQPVRHNGATVVYGNTTRTDKGVTSSPGKSIFGPDRHDSSLVSNDNDKDAAVSGREFAGMRKSQYIIWGVTDKLAGASVSRLKGGAFGVTNHSMTSKYVRRVDEWYYTTGQPTGITVANDSFSRDDAANNSRSNQGEFIVLTTGKVPSQDSDNSKYNVYSRRTG